MSCNNGSFNYVYSCDLDANIQIKIGTLEGDYERPSHLQLIDDPMLRFSGACQQNCPDIYVTCQVYSDGRPIALPMRTSYKSFNTKWNWNEWITLPVKFSDLPLNANLCLTIWDIYGPTQTVAVGSTTISLFSKRGAFRQGMYDLKVWTGVEADGSSDTTTPGKTPSSVDHRSSITKLYKKYRDGHMARVDWLDRLTLREIELIKDKQKRESNFMYVMIEFPHIHFDGTEYTVVYYELGGDEISQTKQSPEIVIVPDPEIGQENLVESKHHKLARSLRSGPTDKDLKPNAATRDQLMTIVSYPPTKQMSSEEKDLVWKFRFYLSSQKTALTKFLKSVDWGVQQEVKQALEMLHTWSAMDTADALELLCPAFTHPAVRKYAVTRLTQADDEELLLYLLQLVQALKYENNDDITAAYEREQTMTSMAFHSERQESIALADPQFENRSRVGSCTSAQSSDMSPEPPASPSSSASEPKLGRTSSYIQEALIEDALEDGGVPMQIDTSELSPEMDLATFLIRRSCNNGVLANYFCWYLLVECDEQDAPSRDQRAYHMYVTVLRRFSLALKRGGEECKLRRSSIAGQQVFMEKLVEVVKTVAREKGDRIKKIEKLQTLLMDTESVKFNFSTFDHIPCPLDPTLMVKGIRPDNATLFKSNLQPCKLTFKTLDYETYVTIFKYGDDLRQDQLVLQIITLMDKLLRKENLDLKLTPYKVLATSSRHGFVQFIEAMAVAEVIKNEGSILAYLRKIAPCENAPLQVSPEVIDNYIKSCAGYSVITYLLGVGDRHLDNLLITNTGKLFHVDFGYILGRDPKPMPPPMRLSREMVEAMGGTESEYFTDFKKLCYTSFLHLRRSANLFLNLFTLMVDANVPDIAIEPDKSVKKVQDRFHLELSDEEAVRYMRHIIDISITATMAALLEQMHKLAQYWRK